MPLLVLALFSLIAGGQENASGWLEVLWRDPPPGAAAPPPLFVLTTDDGRKIQLLPAPGDAAALLRLNRRRVTAIGTRAGNARGDGVAIAIQSIVAEPVLAELAGEVAGPQPWISILCKFSDVAAEPRAPSYFTQMYASSHPGLDHYWREQSAGAIDLAGSGVAG
ncbi:MAG TPA: hypothetical protein VHL59_06195, partial [Thermoanaerobaculia bacterium]|nr:hypothetical protein [Thermoanaerobaculia bacterium]